MCCRYFFGRPLEFTLRHGGTKARWVAVKVEVMCVVLGKPLIRLVRVVDSEVRYAMIKQWEVGEKGEGGT